MEFLDAVTCHDFPEREFIGIRLKCKATEIGMKCGEILPKAFQFFMNKKLTLDKPYVRYHDFSNGNCEMEGGFVVKDKNLKSLAKIEEIKKEGFELTHLKSGSYAKITFKVT
jgi:hypothetical protein